MKTLQLSVVIPAYNAETWLKPTCEKLEAAMRKAEVNDYEIIIVDDGSSDGTKRVADELRHQNAEHLRVLSHANSGRYLTRKKGVETAKYSRILFIDTRVWIDENAIKFLKDQIASNPDRIIWNGHINVAKKGNLIARFGDALTILGWRRYFKNPKLTSYGLKDFDHFPKGTGLFTVPKGLITEAFRWFEESTKDVKNSSDDTLLIRHLAERNRIWLSPRFSATYFARTTLKAFVKHTYYRGQFFVDGFLRPGTRFFYPLIGFLISTVALMLICAFIPGLFVWLIVVALFLWGLELVISLSLGLSVKDALSLFLLSPLFAVVYGLGIWKAVIKQIGNI